MQRNVRARTDGRLCMCVAGPIEGDHHMRFKRFITAVASAALATAGLALPHMVRQV